MKICETFVSFCGEVNVGRFAFFIRAFNCNLNCGWCFGVRPGRRVPRITMLNNPPKKIYDVKIGDILLTLDKNHNVVETKVKDIMKRNVDEWYNITIGKHIYFVTPEHPFFTTTGMKKASELSINDEIYNISYKDKMSFKMKNYNPMFDKDTAIKSAKNTDYIAMGKTLSNTIRKKQEEGRYISPWHKLSDEDKDRLKAFSSKQQLGSNNSNYTHNHPMRNCIILKKLCQTGKITECKNCEKQCITKGSIIVHHIDGNLKNDNLDNLTTICHNCHNKIHKRGYSFWKNGNRKDNKNMSQDKISVMNDFLALSHNGVKVKKIQHFNRSDSKYKYEYQKPASLTVYNLSCAPYNTYLVDYMWVHNCDSKYAKEEHVEMNVKELIAQGKHFPRVVITGGEPFLQKEDVGKLVVGLIKANPFIKIEIETNGTIRPVLIGKYENIIYNVSPKLKNSGNDYEKRVVPSTLNWFNEIGQTNWKFVVENEDDVDEVGGFIANHGIKKSDVFLMPQGKTQKEQMKRMPEIIKWCKHHGYNFSPRFHVLLWGEKRGV